MLCPSCGAPVGRGVPECPQCGSAMFQRDRQRQAIYDQSTEKRLHEETMFCARHEQKRYRLAPQGTDETDASFINRINIEKTPHVLYEHQQIVQRNAPQIPREPGEEG